MKTYLTKTCIAGLMIICCGCAKEVSIHPITGKHLMKMKAGQTYTVPADGVWMSNEYWELLFEGMD